MPQIDHVSANRKRLPTVRTPQPPLAYPPLLQLISQDDQPEIRPAAGTRQQVGKKDVHAIRYPLSAIRKNPPRCDFGLLLRKQLTVPPTPFDRGFIRASRGKRAERPCPIPRTVTC